MHFAFMHRDYMKANCRDSLTENSEEMKIGMDLVQAMEGKGRNDDLSESLSPSGSKVRMSQSVESLRFKIES